MLIALIALSVFGMTAALVIGLGRRAPSAIESRIQDFRSQATVLDEGEADLLSIPFTERVVGPGVEAVPRAASSVLPASMLSNIEKQLIMAGSPMKVNTFVAMWATCVVVMTGFVIFAMVAVGVAVGIQQAAVVLLFGGAG